MRDVRLVVKHEITMCHYPKHTDMWGIVDTLTWYEPWQDWVGSYTMAHLFCFNMLDKQQLQRDIRKVEEDYSYGD